MTPLAGVDCSTTADFIIRNSIRSRDEAQRQSSGDLTLPDKTPNQRIPRLRLYFKLQKEYCTTR
jgi:hypothetical protein